MTTVNFLPQTFLLLDVDSDVKTSRHMHVASRKKLGMKTCELHVTVA